MQGLYNVLVSKIIRRHRYSLSLTTELQAEVSDVCGESDGTFEEIVEKVEEEIEETSE